jgi:hypothetical protein
MEEFRENTRGTVDRCGSGLEAARESDAFRWDVREGSRE